MKGLLLKEYYTFNKGLIFLLILYGLSSALSLTDTESISNYNQLFYF